MSIETWLLDKFLSMEKKVDFLTQRSNTTMATLDEVRAAIQVEKQQSADRDAQLAALQAKVTDLSKQVADGAAATSQQLDEIVSDISGIVNPVADSAPEAPVEPAPEVPVEPAPEEPAADPVSNPAQVDAPVEPAA
jgi:seryl-tRNA synthetase